MNYKFTIAKCITMALSIVLSLGVAAQLVTNPSTYTLRFANPVVNCNLPTSQLCIDLQMKAEDGAPNLAVGSHTVYWSYNKNAINNAVYTPAMLTPKTDSCVVVPGFNYTPWANFNFTNQDDVGTIGEAQFTTILSAYVNNVYCTVFDDANWLTLGSICYDILDDTQPTNIAWDLTQTNFNNSTDSDLPDTPVNDVYHNQGSFTADPPYNFSLTCDCTSFNADFTIDLGDCDGKPTTLCVLVNGGAAPYNIDGLDAKITFENGEYCQTVGDCNNYNLIVTDANGCTKNLFVPVPCIDCGPNCDEMEVVANMLVEPTCLTGGTICIKGFGGMAPYNVSGLPFETDPINENTEKCIANIPPGQYTLVFVDANGCTKQALVNLPTPEGCNPNCEEKQVIIATNITDATCLGNDGQVCLTVSGGAAPYNVSGILGAAVLIDENTEYCFKNVTNSNYTLVITDAETCVFTKNISVAKPADCGPDCSKLKLNIVVTDATCNENGQICVTATGLGGNYYLQGLPSNEIILLTDGVEECITNIPEGIYTLTAATASQEDDCMVTTTVTVYKPEDCGGSCDDFTANFTEKIIETNCSIAYQMCMSISGGTPPYSWQASDLSGTQANYCFDEPGSFAVLITDANGCSLLKQITVKQPISSKINVAVNAEGETCNGNDGKICLDINGGNAPYSISGSGIFKTLNADGQLCITELVSGNYLLKVKDATNCLSTVSAVVKNDCGGSNCLYQYFCTPKFTPIEICPDFCNLTGKITLAGVKPTFECNVEGGDQCFTYKPFPEFTGTDTIMVVGCTNALVCDTVYVVLQIDGCDGKKPIAINDAATTNETETVCIDVFNNDYDTDGDPFYMDAFTDALNGVVTKNGNKLCYTPDPGFTGTDQFMYTICDDDGCDNAVVKVTVLKKGDCENPDNLCTPLNTPIEVCVNFCTVEDAVVTKVESMFNCGLKIINNNCVEFTPLPGQQGQDILYITGCNEFGQCETIVVHINIGDCDPKPCDDSSNPTLICAQPMVPEYFCLVFCEVGDDASITEIHATYDCGLKIKGTKCVEWTPLPGFFGADTLVVTACDANGNCQTISVPAWVSPDGSCPGDPCDDSTNPDIICSKPGITEDFCLVFCNLQPDAFITNITSNLNLTTTYVGNCVIWSPNANSFGEGTMQITACDGTGNCQTINIPTIVSKDGDCQTGPDPCDGWQNPDNLCTEPFTPLEICIKFCTVTDAKIKSATTTFDCSIKLLSDTCLKYTPLPGFFGEDIITITGCNQKGECETVVVHVIVKEDCDGSSDNVPPVALNDNATTPADTPVDICVTNNDYDLNGDIFAVTANTPIPAEQGNLVFNGLSQCFTFIPAAGFTGTVTFTYKICETDTKEKYCAEATVTILVQQECDPNIALCAEPMIPEIICPEFCDLLDGEYQIIGVTATFNCGIQLLSDSCFKYTALPGFFGTDTLTVVACNNFGQCDTAYVLVFVGCTAPIAVDDNVTIPKNTNYLIAVTANDLGICEPYEFIVNILNPPSHGVADVQANLDVLYTPETDYTGTDEFTYVLCNTCSANKCDTAVVKINIIGDPTPIVAQPDIVQTPFETPIDIDVIANDQGENLHVKEFTQPDNGNVTLTPDGTLLYTPKPGFSGVDYFFYTACNVNETICDQTIVSVTVLPKDAPNLPPTANNDNANTPTNTPVTIPVLNNDSDPENGSLTVAITTPPANGTVVVNPNQTVTYTPNEGYNGCDLFTYTITDNGGLTDEAEVIVCVGQNNPNLPPVATPKIITTKVNTPIMGDLLDVVSDPNDADTDLTFSLGSQAANGVATVNADGTYQYQPNANYTGVDYFTYIVCDDDIVPLCDTSYVQINIEPAEIEFIVQPDVATTPKNEPVLIDVLNNDLGCDLQIVAWTQGSHGSVDIVGDKLYYVPNPDYVGEDYFTYTAKDCNGQEKSTLVGITVFDSPNKAPIANDDATTTPINTPVTIDALNNDSDPENEPLVITNVDDPANGTAEIIDNKIVYTPDPNFKGCDVFDYTIEDAQGLQATATIQVCVDTTSGNLPPIANPDFYTTGVNQVKFGNVLDNDSDPNDAKDDLTVTLINDADFGTVTLNADGTFEYIPASGFEGYDHFFYQVCDDDPVLPLCDTSYVQIIIGDPLVLQPDLVQTPYETPITFQVLDNDKGCSLTISDFTQPVGGNVIKIGQNFKFTPNEGFVGPTYFFYTACDCQGACDQTIVNVTVLPKDEPNQPPTANNDNVNTPLDTPITIGVLDNDSDPENQPLSVISVTSPQNGTTVVDNNEIIYTPNPGFVGCDTFSYVIQDNGGLTDQALVIVCTGTANPNLPPIALPDSVYTEINTPVSGQVKPNDSDPNDALDDLTVSLGSPPENGVITLFPDGNFTYLPSSNYQGVDYFTYILCDDDIFPLCDTSWVKIFIGAEVMLLQPDIVQTPFETPITILPKNNDQGCDLDITSLTKPENGQAQLTANDEVIYTPNEGFSGVDYFFYQACDCNGVCDQTIVSVTVLPPDAPNQPPTANNDTGETPLETPITLNVLDNDSDPENQPLIIETVTQPANGTTTIDGDQITYTPNSGFTGCDTFSYIIKDNQGATDTALVQICVNAPYPNLPPFANPAVYNTPINTPVSDDLKPLVNDPDDAIDVLIFSKGSNPAHGSVIINPDGTFDYTPVNDYTGVDYFTYIVCDDDLVPLCDTSYVQINIGVDCNLLVQNDEICIAIDTPAEISPLLNDSGCELSICAIIAQATKGSAVIGVGSKVIGYIPNPGATGIDTVVLEICDPQGQKAQSTVIINIAGIIDLQPDVAYTEQNKPVLIEVLKNDIGSDLTITQLSTPEKGTVTTDGLTATYIPETDFVGTVYFYYKACDCGNSCDSTWVSIVIDSLENNLPPVAVNDVATTNPDEPISIPVTGNDFDPDGDPIEVTDVNPAANGTVEIIDGLPVYTPNPGFVGCDTFTYTICDPFGLCDDAIVAVGVGTDSCLNKKPLAVDDYKTTFVNTPVTIDVKPNDSDPDGLLDDLDFKPITNPAHGSVVDNGDGTFTYTPDENYLGNDLFFYEVCDQGPYPPLCDTAIVFITISPTLIDAQPDIDYTNMDTPVTIDVLANDKGTDITITPTLIDEPEHGTAEVVGDSIVYTPNSGYIGVDYFEYQICDVFGQCDITVVEVIVLPADSTNVPPNAVNDVATTKPTTPIEIDVLNNDNDPFGGDSLVITEFTQPVCGVVAFNADSTQLIFTPATDFLGVCCFNYTICDNGAPNLCDIATVCVTVSEEEEPKVNHPPLADDEKTTTDKNTPVTIDLLDGDTDPDGDNIAITLITQPECGTVANNGDGSVTFTPDTNCVEGENVYFEYVICDDGTPSLCDTAYVTILITDTAQVGCVVAQTIEDTAVEVCATDKVEFVIGSIQVVTAPVNGTLNPIVGNPSCLTYTPNANYCGNDDFTMLVCDALGEICDTVCAVIQITCVNDTPVANNDDLTDVQDCISPADTATIPVLANDTDPDGDLLLIIWVQTPTQQGGTATINTTGDSIIYTPPTGFEGTDSFSYVIQDPDGLTDTALVSICISTDTIDQVIDAVNDTVTTPFNTDLTIDILDNDSYPSGIITVTIITPPQQGVVTNPGDGTPINYNPEDDYEGVDSFQYVLCVQTNPDDPATKICDTAWVYITIEPKPECVLVPANGFSPNGDNKNDCWYISNIANFEICNPGAEVKLLIFNRWGDLMYCPETVNEECVWDGNWQTNGEPAPEGTYYYVITVKPEAGVIEKYNGFIELMR